MHPPAMYSKIVLLLLGVFLPLNMGMTVEEMKNLVKELHNTCVSESGVSEDLINAVNNDKTFADDENLKCYIKCIMQHSGIMSDNGIVDVEAAIGMLPEEYKAEFEPVIRECGTQHGSSPCENAWLTHKCYSQSSIYQLP